MRGALALAALGLVAGCATLGGRGGAAGEYVAYVASESADQVTRVRFGKGGARVEARRPVGSMPVEMEGPHGIAVSPDGRYYYVSIAHGTPFGTLWKYDASTDDALGHVTLGLFPATVDVTPDGEYAFVSNFNLHGDHVASSISKVHLPTMTEVARTETCVMPHGSRVNPQGTKHYSVCMMDQVLVELDVAGAGVSRTLGVAPERGVCAPTWAQPSADGARVYVACSRSAEILEVDVARWEVVRRFSTGEAPYNLAVTPDGRYLLATLKNRTAPGTQVFDLATGSAVTTVPATTVLPHGVAVTPDSRFAVVTAEGVGAAPGKVDVVDLRTLARTASVEVGQQAGGVAVSPR